MVIDGKKMASELGELMREEIAERELHLKLLVIKVGNDKASESFIKIKKKFAESIGVELIVREFPENVSTDELLDIVSEANEDDRVNGIIAQLPLPPHIDINFVLDAIDPSKDPDMLGEGSHAMLCDGQSLIIPPVAGAVDYVLGTADIELESGETDKEILIVGEGKLVGSAVSTWLALGDTPHQVITIDTPERDRLEALANADIIITGAGDPHFIKPDMIRQGVVLIDLGTSELPAVKTPIVGGLTADGPIMGLVGDVDPACALKCSLFTPVPGGMGPVVVAMLFMNLIKLNT